MAIEDILKALEKQGDEEIADILEAARQQARGIEEDAEAEAARIRAASVEAATSSGQSKTSHVVNSARLEARRTVAAVKERAIADAYDDALVELDGLRTSADYPRLFAGLANEALDGLDGEVTVVVDPADEALGAAALRDAGVPGSVEGSAAPSRGGLTVVANDGTMYRRNTVEDRLTKHRETGRASVAGILFG